MVREIPHDSETERTLIGSMLINDGTCREVLARANADDFYEPRHQLIFRALYSLDSENKPIDVTSLTSRLNDQGELDKVGGVEYLLRLVESVPTVAHANYYLEVLHNKAILRRIIQKTAKISEEAYDNVENIDSFIDSVEKEILAITQDRTAGDFLTMNQVLHEVTNRMMLLARNDGVLSGVETGYRDLDKITSGFQKGDLIILAARPAMGKTAFALNIGANASFNSKEAVAIFSLEMPATQLAQRIICAKGGLNSELLRTGSIMRNDQAKYYSAIDTVKKCNLYIDDTPGIKINEIIAKCRNLKRDQGLKLVIIDYLQLITSGGNNRQDNRQQEVSDISRQLKSLARELEIPVIALSQLSRSVEQRTDKTPMLSDLRESGAIEQDADIVSFLYRADYYEKDKEDEDQKQSNNSITDIIIAKHRNGATGKINLLFERDFSRFTTLNFKEEIRKDLRQ